MFYMSKGAAAVVCWIALTNSVDAQNASKPRFNGDFVFRWLAEPSGRHREMQSIYEVSFDDGKRKWSVPRNTVIDGASIPPILWTFEGSPFVGNYRRASVIHDHYCTLTVAPPNEVHWMFYEAMRADGVGLFEARKKYGAVSVYTWFGGGCARGIDAVTDLRSLESPSTFARTDELMANVGRYTTMNLTTVEARDAAEHVKMIAQVRKPASYDSLVQFRLTPSDANFERIQQAFELEDTTAEEVRELSTLVNSAVNSPSVTNQLKQ